MGWIMLSIVIILGRERVYILWGSGGMCIAFKDGIAGSVEGN